MTNQELVALLLQLPPDMPVMMLDSEWGPLPIIAAEVTDFESPDGKPYIALD